MLTNNLSNHENIPPELLTGDEVAAILKVSRSFAYSMMKKGNFPVIKMGRSVRVKKDDLLLFIEKNRINDDHLIF
jgi:excisionase family DNA binding protein